MSKLDLKNWNHEGYAWISGNHGNQLRYNSAEDKTEWLIPIAAYNVGNNSIKYGQPVSIGLKEQLSDESYEDNESAIVITDPSLNDCAVGLALQPGADNDEHSIHIQQYGQIEYDLSKQSDSYYCPSNTKGSFDWLYSDIGKTVYVSNRNKGELTLDVEEAAYDGGTIISVGHLADAPRNKNDVNQKIVIDVQLGGDTRGNVDATQISVKMCRFDGDLDSYKNDVTVTYDNDKVVFVRLINNIGYPVLSDTSLLDNIACSPVGAFVLRAGERIKDYSGKQILLTRLGLLRGNFNYDSSYIGKTGYLNQGELDFVSSSKSVEYKVGICMSENQFLVDCRFPKELQKAEMVGTIKPVFGENLYEPGFALVDDKVHVVIYNEDDPANDKGYDWEELITQCYSKDIFEFSQDPEGPFTRYAEGGWSTVGNQKEDLNILSKHYPVYFKFRDLYYTVDGKTCNCQIKYTVEGSPEQQAYIWPEQMYKLELIAKNDSDTYVLGGAAGKSTVKINITNLVGLGAYMDNNSQNIEAYDIIVRDTDTGRLITSGFWQNADGKWCGFEWQIMVSGDNTYLAMVTIPEGKAAHECYGFTYPIGEKLVKDQKVVLDVIVRRRPTQYNVFFLNQMPTTSPWLPNVSASGNLVTNTSIHFGSIVEMNNSSQSGTSGVTEVEGFASLDYTDTDSEGGTYRTSYINSDSAKKFYDVVSFPNTSYNNIVWIYDLENNVVSLSAEFAPNLIAPSNKATKYVKDVDTDALATLHQIEVSLFDYDDISYPWYKYSVLYDALNKYSKGGYNDDTHVNDNNFDIKFMSLFDKDLTFKADILTKFYKNLTDDIAAVWKNKEYMSYISAIGFLMKAASETEDRLLHLERAAFGSNLVTDPTNNSEDKPADTSEYDIDGLFERGGLYVDSIAKKFGFITDLHTAYDDLYGNTLYTSEKGTSNYARFDEGHSSVFLNFLIDNYSDYYDTDDLKNLRNEWYEGLSTAEDKAYYIYKRIMDFVATHEDSSAFSRAGYSNFERNTMFVNALDYTNYISSHEDIFDNLYSSYENCTSLNEGETPVFTNRYSLLAKNITFSKLKYGYSFEFEEIDGKKERIDNSYNEEILTLYKSSGLEGVPFKWPIQADKAFAKYFDREKNNSLEKIFFDNTLFGISDKAFNFNIDESTNNFKYDITDVSVLSQSLEGYIFDIIAKLSYLRKEHTDETVFKGSSTIIDPYIYMPSKFGTTPLVNDILYFNNEDDEYPVYSAFTFKNNKIFKGYSLEFKGDISKIVWFSSELARSKKGYSGAYFSWQKNGIDYKFKVKDNFGKLVDYGITEPFEDINDFWSKAYSYSNNLNKLNSYYPGMSEAEKSYWNDFFSQYRDVSSDEVKIPDLLVSFRPTKYDYETKNKSIQRSLNDQINNFNDHFINRLEEIKNETIIPEDKTIDNDKYDRVSVTRVIGTRRDVIDDRNPFVKLSRDADTSIRDFNSCINNQNEDQDYRARNVYLEENGNERYLYTYSPSYKQYYYNSKFNDLNFRNLKKVNVSKLYDPSDVNSYHDGYIEYTNRPVSSVARKMEFNKKWVYKRLYYCDIGKGELVIECERKKDATGDEFYVYWYDGLPVYIENVSNLSEALLAVFKVDDFSTARGKSSLEYASAYASEPKYLDCRKNGDTIIIDEDAGRVVSENDSSSNINSTLLPIDWYYLCKFKEYCESGVNPVSSSISSTNISNFFKNEEGTTNYYLVPPYNSSKDNKVRELCRDVTTIRSINLTGSYDDLKVWLDNKIFYLSPYTKTGQKDFYITENHYASGSLYFEYIDGRDANSINIDITDNIQPYIDTTIAAIKVNDEKIHDFYNSNIQNYTDNIDAFANEVINTQVKDWINLGIEDLNSVIKLLDTNASNNLTAKLQWLVDEVNAGDESFAKEMADNVISNVNTALTNIRNNVKANTSTLVDKISSKEAENHNDILKKVESAFDTVISEINESFENASSTYESNNSLANDNLKTIVNNRISDIKTAVKDSINGVITSFNGIIETLVKDIKALAEQTGVSVNVNSAATLEVDLIEDVSISAIESAELFASPEEEPSSEPAVSPEETSLLKSLNSFQPFSQYTADSFAGYYDLLKSDTASTTVEQITGEIAVSKIKVEDAAVESLFESISSEEDSEGNVVEVHSVPEVKQFEAIEDLKKMEIPELVSFEIENSLVIDSDLAWDFETNGEVFNINKMTASITLGSSNLNSVSYKEIYPERHAEGMFEIKNNYNESDQEVCFELETAKTKTALSMYGLDANKSLPSLERILRPGDNTKIVNTFEFDDSTYIYGAQLPQIDSLFKLRSSHINDIFTLSQSEKPAKKSIIENNTKPDVKPQVITDEDGEYNDIVSISYNNKFTIENNDDYKIEGIKLIKVMTDKPLDSTMHVVYCRPVHRKYTFDSQTLDTSEPELDLRNIKCWNFNDLTHTGCSTKEAVNDLKASYMAEYGVNGEKMWDEWCKTHGWYPWPDGTNKNYFGGADIFKYTVEGRTGKFEYEWNGVKLRDCTDDQIRQALSIREAYTVDGDPVSNCFLDNELIAGADSGDFIYYQIYVLKSTNRNFIFVPQTMSTSNKDGKRYLDYNSISKDCFMVFSDTNNFISETYDVHGIKVQNLMSDLISGNDLVKMIGDGTSQIYTSGTKLNEDDKNVVMVNGLNKILKSNSITEGSLENKDDLINLNFVMPEIDQNSCNYSDTLKLFEVNTAQKEFISDKAFTNSDFTLKGV